MERGSPLSVPSVNSGSVATAPGAGDVAENGGTAERERDERRALHRARHGYGLERRESTDVIAELVSGHEADELIGLVPLARAVEESDCWWPIGVKIAQ